MLAYTAVTTVVALRATPLLQEWLGQWRYGAFRVVVDAYGYLTLLEMGLGGALAPLLARAVGQEDERALGATVSAGVRSYLRVSAVMVVVGLTLTPLVHRFASGLSGPEIVDL